MEKKSAERPVIVCTEHRGVFFGYVNEDESTKTTIKKLSDMAKALTEAGLPDLVCASVIGQYSQTLFGSIHLKRACMAIYFGTNRGVMELAETGPTNKSKISARADIDVRKITAVMEVAPEAMAKWEAAS